VTVKTSSLPAAPTRCSTLAKATFPTEPVPTPVTFHAVCCADPTSVSLPPAPSKETARPSVEPATVSESARVAAPWIETAETAER
jgi:hypothetical protein